MTCMASDMESISSESPEKRYWRPPRIGISMPSCSASSCISACKPASCMRPSIMPCKLGTLLGRHRLQHVLHALHLLLEVLKKLVDVLMPGGKLWPCFCMNSLKWGSRPSWWSRSIWLRSCTISRMASIACGSLCIFSMPSCKPEKVFCTICCWSRVEQFLELLPGIGVHEVVLFQALDLARRDRAAGCPAALCGGWPSSPASSGTSAACSGELAWRRSLAALLRPFAGSRLVALRLLAAFFNTAVDSGALGLFDLFEALADVVHDGVHVVVAQGFLARLLEAVEQVAQAGHFLARLEPVALLHQLFEGALYVAMGQDVFGQSVHDGVGVEWHDLLGTVPA